MKRTIITGSGEIDAGTYDEITFDPELAMILFTAGNLYYDTVYQLPMTFSNRFSAQEAFSRISMEEETTDITDISCEWPAQAAARIGDRVRKLRDERGMHFRETTYIEDGGKVLFRGGRKEEEEGR